MLLRFEVWWSKGYDLEASFDSRTKGVKKFEQHC